jgi:4-amino-4-deoxy-L-arabinose transferase-like glycosyltransferase
MLVELWPASARPYIGGSQHNSIVELALGYNGFGRINGNEPGGLGNLNFDVGWGRLFGNSMGQDIAWLLPAAVICITAGFIITRRTPRTDATRAALIIWGGWLVVTALVFSFANGILHSYYSVALAPAIGAGIGIGATLLWRRRADLPAATALSGAVVVTTVLAAVLLARNGEWMPWLRAAVAIGGVGSAVLLLVAARLTMPVARAVATIAVVSCLAAPAAYSIATAATPHSGAIPSVGPSGHGFAGPVGLLDSPDPGEALTAMLTADASDFTWAAAVVGSNNAAGYQLASGAPVMAIGGFNGTDPSPTLEQFRQDVAERKIHYFVHGNVMTGHWGRARTGSHDAADIADWVETHYTPQTVDRVQIYDLTQPPHKS